MNYYLKVVINTDDSDNICSLIFGTLEDQVWTIDGNNIHYMEEGVVKKEYNTITKEKEGIFKKIIVPIKEKELVDILAHPYNISKISKKNKYLLNNEDTIRELIHEYSTIKGKKESKLA